eukprot:9389863-Ditylum_brightwellii.AAC.1
MLSAQSAPPPWFCSAPVLIYPYEKVGKLAEDSLISAVALFFPADEIKEFLPLLDHVMIVWIVVDPIRDPLFWMKSATI